MSSLSRFEGLLRLKNQHHFVGFSFFICPHDCIILSFILKSHHHFDYGFFYVHMALFLSHQSVPSLEKNRKKIYYRSDVLLV